MGGVVLPSHMNCLMHFVSAVSTGFGMPCALVKNCVIPPTTIWTMSRLPSSVGWPKFHRVRFCSIFVSTGSQGAAWSSSFPTQAPRVLMGLPSLAILTWSDQGSSSSLNFLLITTDARCAGEPIGRISVFSRLNLAPDARHQDWRMSSRSDRL